MTQMIAALIFTFGLASSLPAFAQSWSGNTRGIGNAAINCSAVKPQSNGLIVFVGCRTNGGLPTLWRTTDGGAIWQPVRHFSEIPITIDSIVFDEHKPQAILVYGPQDHTVWRSLDGGETWVRRIVKITNTSNLHVPPRALDTTTVVWDSTRRMSFDPWTTFYTRLFAAHDTVVVTWQVGGVGPYFFVTQSFDNGISWSQPAKLPDTIAYFNTQAQFKLVPPNMYFYANYYPQTIQYTWLRRWSLDDTAWGNGRILFPETFPGLITGQHGDIVVDYLSFTQGQAPFFAHSNDLGTTWSRPPLTLTPGRWSSGLVLSGNRLYMVREREMFSSPEIAFSSSTDFGATWAAEVFLSSLDTLLSDLPHIAADTAGNVYTVWRDMKYGSSTGFGGTIMLRRSTDYGATWLAEQALTTFPSGVIARVATLGGRLAVVWYNEVITGSGEVHYLRCRISVNYGQDWSGEYALTPEMGENFHPDIAMNENHIHVSWVGSVSGNLEIFYRHGTFITTGVRTDEEQAPAQFVLGQNYPNPFNPSTTIRFVLPKTSYVTLKVSDLLGREVAALVNEQLALGSYERTLNADRLASGVYFYRLQTDEFTQTKKLLLLR